MYAVILVHIDRVVSSRNWYCHPFAACNLDVTSYVFQLPDRQCSHLEPLALFWTADAVHCRSAFEPGGSGLPYYCAPPVCIPAVLGALAVWRLSTKTKKRPADGILPILVRKLAVGVVPATAIPNRLLPFHGFLLFLKYFPGTNLPASCFSMKSATHVP